MADPATAENYLVMNFGDSSDDDDVTTEELEGGNLLITMGKSAPDPSREEGGFYENLAEVLPEPVLTRIGAELLRRIEQDKAAREPRDKQYEEGIKRTGMGKDAPGGADFPGASKVVHPMLTEASVDYESRIIKELWPIAGPVKKKLLGTPTKEKDERAERKVSYMNYQLTTLIKEARSTMESNLTQVPLGGAGYIRQWQDHRLKRPRWGFVGVDKVYLPANASSYYSAHRRTFAETISEVEFQQRINQQIYRDLELPAASGTPEASKTEEANAKVEGVDKSGVVNVDGDREIYETMAYLEVEPGMAGVLKVEEEGELNPYLITLDVTTKRVLAFYRDWEPDDEAREPIDHLFEFPFLPWDGAYGIGLPHIIGGLSGAATGALRALLDSAHIANAQTYYVLKGTGVGGQNKNPVPGTAVEIESGLETDDIRKKIMTAPVNQPSPVLFQLLGFVVEAAKGVVRTSMDETAIDTNTNVPVGTQLSRVEEGLVVFSSIHGRIHAAFDRLLGGLHRLNRLYLPETVRVDTKGKEILVYRADFEGPADVQPVSDPTVYSDQQRFMQMQALEDSALKFQGLYDIREIQLTKLKLYRIPEPERYLITQPKPIELNAVNENVAMSLGRPVVAFPEQDHLAHLQCHLDFLQSPVLGANPLIAQTFLPMALKHCTEHIVMQYAKTNVDLVSRASGRQAHDLFSEDEQVKAALDRLLAMASQHVVPQMGQMLARAMPVLQQGMAALQHMQQQAQQGQQLPMDPAAMAAAQVAGAEVQRKSKDDQVQGALAQAKQAQDAANDRARNAVDWARVQAMTNNAQTAASARIAVANMDVQSAKDIASQRIESGQRPAFSDGASLGGG